MGYSYKFIYRNDCIRKDKTVHVLLRVTIDRETMRHKTGIFIDPNKWDLINQRVKGNSPITNAQNKHLKTIYVKTVETFTSLEKNNQPITHENFTAIFRSNTAKKQDFYELWQNYIDEIDGKFAKGTVNHQVYGRRKMMRFIHELDLNQLNTALMIKYEKHMRNTLKNDSNTIRSSVKRIHVVLNHLVKNKIIAVNPIKGFQVKGESSKRVYLSPEELESFELLVAKGRLYNKERRSVYNYFLFSCYTGLRFSDIRDLEFKDIVITEKGSYIHLKMQKTKEVITIPLTKKAKALIKNYENGNESVFKVYESQKTNTILRELIADAGIEKHISFHCARHTFATLALNKDMPLAAIQKLLGHNSVKTTQLYSKIMDMTIFKEMEKME